MKKNDVKIILGILFFALLMLVGYNGFAKIGDEICVYVDGVEFGRYYLNEEQTVHIQGTNILEIKNGEARMIDADCPDELCMHQKSISKNRESIICLPNKISVEVISKKENEFDAIVQ